MQLNGNNETRVERAVANGRRKPSKRAVKLPGAASHSSTDESAELIARRIQLAKMEKRAGRK